MEQYRITERGPLLDEKGGIGRPGWATELLYAYDPKAVKANKLRIKEWDYYIMLSNTGEYALSLCIADNRYMGLADAAFLDIKNGVKHDFLIPMILPMGKLHMRRRHHLPQSVLRFPLYSDRGRQAAAVRLPSAREQEFFLRYIP